MVSEAGVYQKLRKRWRGWGRGRGHVSRELSETWLQERQLLQLTESRRSFAITHPSLLLNFLIFICLTHAGYGASCRTRGRLRVSLTHSHLIHRRKHMRRGSSLTGRQKMKQKLQTFKIKVKGTDENTQTVCQEGEGPSSGSTHRWRVQIFVGACL